MKTLIALLVLLGSASLGAAQTSDEPAAARQVSISPPEAPVIPPANDADLLTAWPQLNSRDLESMVQFQTQTVTRILGVDMTVDGVVPRVRRARNPFQLLNPFAPAEYGSGEEVTSINPRTGKAEGIVLLGIKF